MPKDLSGVIMQFICNKTVQLRYFHTIHKHGNSTSIWEQQHMTSPTTPIPGTLCRNSTHSISPIVSICSPDITHGGCGRYKCIMHWSGSSGGKRGHSTYMIAPSPPQLVKAD